MLNYQRVSDESSGYNPALINFQGQRSSDHPWHLLSLSLGSVKLLLEFS
jgi:hypothetical protein